MKAMRTSAWPAADLADTRRRWEKNRGIDEETLESGRQSEETTHRKVRITEGKRRRSVGDVDATRQPPRPHIWRFAKRSGYRLALGHGVILFLL